MVGQARALIACCSVLVFAGVRPELATARELDVHAACRDGMPHGPYELRAPNGQLRVSGAFSRGIRTGSFIYWTRDGARIAHVPYDDDRKNGTVSLWYATSRSEREPQSKLQAGFAAGRRNGVTRSWYPNGRPRTLFRYEMDVLADAQAWSRTGSKLSAADAREVATRDRDRDDKYYASLDAIVTGHLPDCRDRP
jgi:antitoxin component YwqK of YwqJK toxin-antitoxin module